MTAPAQIGRPWLAEGAQVARIRSNHGRGGSVETVTVRRIGKLHVALHGSDERFRVADLRSIAPRGTFDTAAAELVALDDPRVRRIVGENKRQRARLDVQVAADHLRKSRSAPDEGERIRDVRAALDKLEAVLAEYPDD